MGDVINTDAKNAALTHARTGVHNRKAGGSFIITAGVNGAGNIFGYMINGYQGTFGIGGAGFGAFVSGNVKGLTPVEFASFPNPDQQLELALQNSLGTETFTLSFTDANATQFVLLSSSGTTAAFTIGGVPSGFSWTFSFGSIAGTPHFNNGTQYTINWT